MPAHGRRRIAALKPGLHGAQRIGRQLVILLLVDLGAEEEV